MKAKLKLIVWLTLVIAALLGMKMLSNSYGLNHMREALDTYYWPILLGYAFLISIRGLLFIPTLPLILLMASAIEAQLVFVITLTASCISAYLVCVAVDLLEIQSKIQSLPQKSVGRAQDFVRSYGIAAVAAWAFFPLVFTEIIVYLARLAGLPRRHIVTAVGIGEGLMILLIIAVTGWLTNFLL